SYAGGAGAATGNPALGGAAGGVGGLGGVGSVGGISGLGSPGVGSIGSLGGSSGTIGTHQGHILTGPGATGTPLNYFRGAAPGMNLWPQQAPSGAFLKELNGSNNGRRTGHAALGSPRRYQRSGLSSDPSAMAPPRVEERAVYFAQRGAYEDSVYRPNRGTYRQPRRATPANRNRRAY
ncbi:MAG: hypothetical protein ACREHD_24555, partial [Pirellulales bacterium]